MDKGGGVRKEGRGDMDIWDAQDSLDEGVTVLCRKGLICQEGICLSEIKQMFCQGHPPFIIL